MELNIKPAAVELIDQDWLRRYYSPDEVRRKAFVSSTGPYRVSVNGSESDSWSMEYELRIGGAPHSVLLHKATTVALEEHGLADIFHSEFVLLTWKRHNHMYYQPPTVRQFVADATFERQELAADRPKIFMQVASTLLQVHTQ